MVATTPDLLHDFTVTSFGGISCAQIYADFVAWEAILNTHPEVKAIVEIGTWTGGFSLWLLAQADIRGLQFQSYDVIPPWEVEGGVTEVVADIVGPGWFEQMDVFHRADDFREGLASWVELGPIVLFCDGGNKPRELREFAASVPSGSLVAVHDWGTETFAKDVPAILEPIHHEYLEGIGSITRWFLRP